MRDRRIKFVDQEEKLTKHHETNEAHITIPTLLELYRLALRWANSI